MAHWAGTGPPGTTCSSCGFYHGWCKKFRSMMLANLKKRWSPIPVPGHIPSCKYYEQKVSKK
jgi:hypothetical protein